jgi:hypothetical protein
MPESSRWSAVRNSASVPTAANDAHGWLLRITPGTCRKQFTIAPMWVAGVSAGSNAGIDSYTSANHSGGSGGFCQSAGSVQCDECVGIRSVPTGPTVSSSASTAACAPPTTHPICESDECTSNVSPTATPSVWRSATIEARVTGRLVVAATTVCSVGFTQRQRRQCGNRSHNTATMEK